MTWGDDLATKLLGSALPRSFDRCLATWETPTQACQLISLEDLKDALGITDAAQDDELTRLIGVYSQSIENYLERQMCSAAREVVFIPLTSCQTPKLVLPQFPVASIESVDMDGAVLDAAQWVVNGNTGDMYPADAAFWNFANYVLVKYTAGYDPIPPDLENAVIQLINGALTFGAGAGAKGPVKSQRVEGAVTETFYDPRTASASSGSYTGAADIGRYVQVLDYYRGERAFI